MVPTVTKKRLAGQEGADALSLLVAGVMGQREVSPSCSLGARSRRSSMLVGRQQRTGGAAHRLLGQDVTMTSFCDRLRQIRIFL